MHGVDRLTGLPDRAALFALAATALQAAGGTGVAAVLCDLDRLQLVNEALGHAAGDDLLVQVATRLRAVAGEAVVGRFSGDVFALVTTGRDPQAELTAALDAARVALVAPFTVGDRELYIGATVGAAVAEAGDDADDLLRKADAALAEAKDGGRGRTAVFNAAAASRGRRHLSMETALRRAVAADEFRVSYQVQVSGEPAHVYGVEALVRWQRPEHGLVAPDEFLALAHETGLVVDIDRWVLDTALADLRIAEQAGRALALSVNIDPRTLVESDLPGLLADLFGRHGVSPRSLCLEVTESAVITDPDGAARSLHALRELGVRLALDDFGTGWSSLSHLHRLPFHEIKLDRSYVGCVDRDPGSATLVRAIAGLAADLGLDVVAEGVETVAVWDAVRALGCSRGQGWLFGHPAALDDLLAALGNAELPSHVLTARHRAERMLADGASPATVAAALNAEGLRRPDGRRWHHRSVLALLAAAAPAGDTRRRS